MITGKTKKHQRESIIASFKAQRIKYLVNVSVLTTGFDAPHVDCIAILRKTESPGLLQQIIGRSLRLYDGKKNALILDYAENLEEHCPDGDVFSPDIQVAGVVEDAGQIKVQCPVCMAEQEHTGRPNPDGYHITQDGYFADLMGNKITSDAEDPQPIPAHYGRRCTGEHLNPDTKQFERCAYRWSLKVCGECDHENDIAARYCEACGGELVDPNEKLRLDFGKIKADPYTPTNDKVIAWNCRHHVSKADNELVKIHWTTTERTITTFHMPSRIRDWHMLSLAVYGKIAPDVDAFLRYWQSHGNRPVTITCAKDRRSGFWQISAYNREETKWQE